ncbi:MAG: hypothetical protein JSR17_06745 [Proteobacteria bacterium]|nr:hypothetical protein [Pseudomonadota bacterium]
MKQYVQSILRKSSEFFSKKSKPPEAAQSGSWQHPRLFIVSHFYQGQTIQVLIQDSKGKKITQDIQSLARQKKLIKQLSAQDAFLLGYLLAEDSFAKSF